MENFIINERRSSQRVPVQISALGEFEGRRIAMYSENIGRDGMFVVSADFLPPRSVFSARVWLSADQEPLDAYLTSCFIDRTWASYGIGVCISGISTADKKLWEDFYHGCVEAHTEQQRALSPAARPTGKRCLVVVNGALSPLTMQALRKPGLEVTHVASVSEAFALVHERPIDAVISDLRSPGVDGLALCREMSQCRRQTRMVLLSDGGTPNDFLMGIHAGAARVIGKQCSPNVLVSRILQALDQRVPSGPGHPVPEREKRNPEIIWNAATCTAPASLPGRAWAPV